MIFITKFSKASFLTYINIAVAVAGVYLVTVDIRLALACLFVCAVLDFFDGRFARSIKNRTEYDKKFGVIIDSLGDVLMFSALPSVILFNIISCPIAAISIAIVYVSCGITRLSVFTVETEPGKKNAYYRGLPITTAGAIIPIAYFASLPTSDFAAEIIMLSVYLTLAVLFVLNIKVKKP